MGEFEEGVLEEKEIYYIEKYDTYKNGYNATLGGDGARYFTHSNKEVVDFYRKIKSRNETAKHFNCCPKTISTILREEGIEPNLWLRDSREDKVRINEIDKLFNSKKECVAWLVENEYTKGDPKRVFDSLNRCLSGKRNSYLGFTFIVIK